MTPQVTSRDLRPPHATPVVCDYRGLQSRLKKLKKQTKKTDEYLAYVKERIVANGEFLAKGRFASGHHILVPRYRQFLDEERQTQERLQALAEEVGQVLSLFGQCTPCHECRACLFASKGVIYHG